MHTMTQVSETRSRAAQSGGGPGIGQLSLALVPCPPTGTAHTPQRGGLSADGLDHHEKAEHARRIAVGYGVLGEIALAEKAIRSAYRRQAGRRGTTLPHRHPDVAGSPSKCAVCAVYGSSSTLMAKLAISKLESIPRVHLGREATLYRKSVADTYLATGQETVGPEDLFAMFGDFWWDTVSFAVGVSKLAPRDLAELALLLPAGPSPFSGAPASLGVRWLADAALVRLRGLMTQRSGWAAIHSRIVAEVDQRSRGSQVGAPPEPLELEFWRMKNPTLARRELVPARAFDQLPAPRELVAL